MKRRTLTRILLVAILFLAYSVVAFDAGKEDDRGYIVKVGDKVPNFSLKLINGETIEVKDLRGKVVMLQFTASWCSVCRKEMPFIEKDIWQKHKAKSSFALFGVDMGEKREQVTSFVDDMGTTYPMALDENADIFALFAERKAGVTRNVIIDKDGTIVYLTRLFNEVEFNAMTEKIDQLLENEG